MSREKIPTRTTLPVKTWPVAERAVEDGVRRGIQSFFKHREDVAPDGLGDAIERAVMGELAEWFEFNNDTKEIRS